MLPLTCFNKVGNAGENIVGDSWWPAVIYSSNLNQTDLKPRTKERQAIPLIKFQEEKQGLYGNRQGIYGEAPYMDK